MAEGLRCSRCPNPKLPYHAWCRECRNAYARKNRPKYCELRPEVRKRANARSYANTYQRRGKLTPQPCEKCGESKTHKRHDNFDKPLEVRWLCRKCDPLKAHPTPHADNLLTVSQPEAALPLLLPRLSEQLLAEKSSEVLRTVS